MWRSIRRLWRTPTSSTRTCRHFLREITRRYPLRVLNSSRYRFLFINKVTGRQNSSTSHHWTLTAILILRSRDQTEWKKKYSEFSWHSLNDNLSHFLSSFRYKYHEKISVRKDITRVFRETTRNSRVEMLASLWGNRRLLERRWLVN